MTKLKEYYDRELYNYLNDEDLERLSLGEIIQIKTEALLHAFDCLHADKNSIVSLEDIEGPKTVSRWLLKNRTIIEDFYSRLKALSNP